MNYVITYSEDFLQHHGIKGQKWGIRRFQNKDRTWTKAGKERYGDDAPSANERHKKRVKAIKVGVAVAGTAAVAFGAAYLVKKYGRIKLSSVSSNSINNGKKVVAEVSEKVAHTPITLTMSTNNAPSSSSDSLDRLKKNAAALNSVTKFADNSGLDDLTRSILAKNSKLKCGLT